MIGNPPGPRPRKSLSHLTEAESAFIGAWLSSDGTIVQHTGAKRGITTYSIRVKWCITDLDPLIKIRSIIGVNRNINTVPPSGFGKKDRHYLVYTGDLAMAIVWECWPWLSDRYKSRYTKFISNCTGRLAGKSLHINDVRDIKSRLKKGVRGVGRELALEYNVTDGMISAIKHGRSWSDVEAS